MEGCDYPIKLFLTVIFVKYCFVREEIVYIRLKVLKLFLFMINSSMLEVIILGCGSSLGVPVLCCSCSVCRSASRFNKRTRSSILIRDKNTTVLVDAGYDIKLQLLRENILSLDAVILTHAHVDHSWGIDDLRPFVYSTNKPLQVYSNQETASIIMDKFDYLFKSNRLKMNIIESGKNFFIKKIQITVFNQIHGRMSTLGVKIKNFIYSCDVLDFSEEVEQYLYDLQCWIVDCIDHKPNKAHAGLEQILKWNEKFRPHKLYLTGMSHNISYDEIIKTLPKNIMPLCDGYKLYVE